MIEITLLFKNEIIKGFEITGHADYDEYGKDIVCAAVSVLAYTTVNSLDSYNINFEFSDDDDLMKLISEDNSLELDVILNTFKTGILTLEQSYRDFVKTYSKEI